MTFHMNKATSVKVHQFLNHMEAIVPASLYNNNKPKCISCFVDQWWYKSQGPIFVYTGNEGNIEGFWKNTGFIFDIAPQFKALVVFIEHVIHL